jgi:ankyrin repeat protein
MVLTLINAGENINQQPVLRGTPLYKAIGGENDLDLVRILLDAGANTNAPSHRTYGMTSLQNAAR